MKSFLKTITALASALLLAPSQPAASLNTGDWDMNQQAGLAETTTYSSLTGLLMQICADASIEFKNFFGPAPIRVEPFAVLGEFGSRKRSLLGATLADQMRAMVNNTAVSPFDADPSENNHPQKLNGVIQELDGFLRIHVLGLNEFGDRRSFVANVEMSESIYRALHTPVR